MQPEIYAYFKDVARKYDIDNHVRFQSVVESAVWEDDSGTWLVTIRDLKTTRVTQRRCKIMISAVGALSIPRKCEIPGASKYQGRMFHTAEWDHSFDWKNKEVVVIGKSRPKLSWIDLTPLRKWVQRDTIRSYHQRR